MLHRRFARAVLVAGLRAARLLAVAAGRDRRGAHGLAFQTARAELLLQTLLRLRAQTQLALDGVLVFLVQLSAG